MTRDFWKGRRVFLTGHTGFKGSWLSLWLQIAGAEVAGYSLASPSQPSLFEMARVSDGMLSLSGDVRDFADLHAAISRHQPEVVIHMAAQALVRYSYRHPVETYATNIMGTVHLLEAIRQTSSVKSVIIVTSDKCYDNKEWVWGYRENEGLGGHDPYSSSKGCAEMVVAAFRKSFFGCKGNTVAIASVRAGNVIGGGDWATDRLIPDAIRSISKKRTIMIRNPNAMRPWQHVLDPLSGYLTLAEKLLTDGDGYAEGWNFGSNQQDTRSVKWIMERMCSLWGGGAGWEKETGEHPHEAHYLNLDSSKARVKLGWKTKLDLSEALVWVVDWYKAYSNKEEMRRFTEVQIEKFEER